MELMLEGVEHKLRLMHIAIKLLEQVTFSNNDQFICILVQPMKQLIGCNNFLKSFQKIRECMSHCNSKFLIESH